MHDPPVRAWVLSAARFAPALLWFHPEHAWLLRHRFINSAAKAPEEDSTGAAVAAPTYRTKVCIHFKQVSAHEAHSAHNNTFELVPCFCASHSPVSFPSIM